MTMGSLNTLSFKVHHGSGRRCGVVTLALLVWLGLAGAAQGQATAGASTAATSPILATTAATTAPLATPALVSPTPVTTPTPEQSAVRPPLRRDERSTACQGLRVAALGPERVVVGWTIPEGPAMGVYLRQRLNYQWEPARKVIGVTGEQPRDLDLALDALGRLHLAWTAREGATRRVYYNRQDANNTLTPITIIRPVTVVAPATVAGPTTTATPTTVTAPTTIAPLTTATLTTTTATTEPAEVAATAPGALAGEADFPVLAVDGMGVVVAWQESRALRFMVHAARIAADGAVSDLGCVSGVSTSGMAPQILAVSPALCVAWYEITETGSELRVSEWLAGESRWEPSAVEREGRLFPHDMQVLLDRTDTGLVACWQDCLADGRSAIKVGLVLPPVDTKTPELASETMADPSGDHSEPHLSGSLPGRLTLSWQVFSQGQQSIRLATIFGPKQEVQALTISTPGQRFAAMPDHVTVGNWSAVAWTDDTRTGGQGGVYFTEVNWPSGT